uniref:Kazal-like domain-containing protein n=1 Tax=Erpetoichthys calabaricus TaxID=27687 RepID=A0A8C4RN28_ERPCA
MNVYTIPMLKMLVIMSRSGGNELKISMFSISFTSYLTLLQNFCHKYTTPLDCPIELEFICGDDGNSYQNECHLGFEYLCALFALWITGILFFL